MRKILFTLCLVAIPLCLISCGDEEITPTHDEVVQGGDSPTMPNQGDGLPVSVTEKTTCNYTTQATFTKSGTGDIVRFVGIIPIPLTNEYQTVKNLTYSDGTLMEDANYGNKALVNEKSSFPSQTLTMQSNFEITTKSVKVDFTKITIKDYDKEGEPYRKHLGNRGEYINTSHPFIVNKGNELWEKSTDIIDYARKCYEFTASYFHYKNGSFRTLQQILDDGGGECGDFATIVVNLLRYKGIPSRHIICLKLEGGFHVWADFYLEGYGWIPLDAQMKNANPRGDYFGQYNGECVVMAKDLIYDYNLTDININFLQNYAYWYWYSGDVTRFYVQYTSYKS